MIDATPLAGLLLGAAGSVHCVAMCGGLATAVDATAPPGRTGRAVSAALSSLGRVASYALLGAALGASGSLLGALVAGPGLPRASRLVVGGLLILLGVGLAGWLPAARLERAGLAVWRRLQPLARPIRRLPAPLRALGLGALWGFLPCGLVYAAAAVAAATGTAGGGALFMLAFGLGTVPAVLPLGLAGGALARRLGSRAVRRGSGVLVSACGVWIVVATGLMTVGGHVHHH